MRKLTRWFVATVAVCAVAGTWVLFSTHQAQPSSLITDVLVLSALAIAGDTLSVLLPRSAMGSMAFIPYLALAFVVPGWPAVLAVTAVRFVGELWCRRVAIKAVFNVSSHALMELVAVSTYLALGGTSLSQLPTLHSASIVTRTIGWAAILACAVALIVNNVLAALVIAIDSGRSPIKVWLENHRSTVGIDLLATPLVVVFAWVYAAFGAIATATLWIPILGLRQLQRTNLELERTNQELLELMVKSLEARDPYTSGHSRRVHHYSTVIARALGLREREVDQIGRAALLHDVGKIHEKYAAVLAKSENLTPEEWAIIQEHPNDGADLVATMTKLADVVPGIRHHHENWDGTGYPLGLAGEQIPMASRIIRFADTIDAMTTERPYRLPLTEAQVRSEIVRGRATQFDPTIADRLLSSPFWSLLFASSRTGPGPQISRGPRLLRVPEERQRDKSAIIA
jgi:HD-GYP domain-containing protein (c-di-GMP phosphodiesterase class II)